MTALQAPYATCSPHEVSHAYGEVAGATPNWRGLAGLGGGKRHAEGTPSELGRGGFEAWQGAAAPHHRMLYKTVSSVPCAVPIAEPCVQGGNQAYYLRRTLGPEESDAYRRTTRNIPLAEPVDRPTHKRHAPPERSNVFHDLPEPQSQQGPTYRPSKEPETMREPGMPRYGRPHGATILRESDQELVYERAYGKKGHVGRTTYWGTGRAGDQSQSYAPTRRPEDDLQFFKSNKDSPTFSRFVASLRPGDATPHERHAAGLQRQAAAEREADRALVAQLALPQEEGYESDG